MNSEYWKIVVDFTMAKNSWVKLVIVSGLSGVLKADTSSVARSQVEFQSNRIMQTDIPQPSLQTQLSHSFTNHSVAIIKLPGTKKLLKSPWCKQVDNRPRAICTSLKFPCSYLGILKFLISLDRTWWHGVFSYCVLHVQREGLEG